MTATVYWDVKHQANQPETREMLALIRFSKDLSVSLHQTVNEGRGSSAAISFRAYL